jgi:DNA-directed RNA polymerase specialized sigma subunit
MNKSEFITKVSEKRFCDNFIRSIFGIKTLNESVLLIYSKELYDNAEEFVKSLPIQNRQVMETFFREGKSIEEIGKKLSIDNDIVGRIVAEFLRFMRHPSRAKQFSQYTIRLEDDTN